MHNQQGTLGAKAEKERDPLNLKKWGSDKLSITVYEIADSEQLDPAWGRGRKQTLKYRRELWAAGQLATKMKGIQK